MAKFKVLQAVHSLRMLLWEQEIAGGKASQAETGGTDATLTSSQREVFGDFLDEWEKMFAVFECHAILDRVQWCRKGMAKPDLTWRRFEADARVLRETIESEMGRQLFWHYPPSKAAVLQAVGTDWAPVLAAFKRAELDIRDGASSYAADLNTATVFHMMRVAEHGLRALASERRVQLHRNKPLTHENWLKIIEETEKKVAEIQRNAPAGDGKEVALSFYNGALAHLRALKDRYRNRVMHAREIFNPHEAADAMFHTKSLMMGIAERLTDQSNKQIRWKF